MKTADITKGLPKAIPRSYCRFNMLVKVEGEKNLKILYFISWSELGMLNWFEVLYAVCKLF